MDVALTVRNVWKQYRIGSFDSSTLREEVQEWWARFRGALDPHCPAGAGNAPSQLRGQAIWALQDVSLDLRYGEVLGVIGPNGSGKSTLLKIIAGVTAPTKGTVKIGGKLASMLEVGTGFHPDLTGRENVYLNAAIMGMKKAEIAQKFDSIVHFAGVEEFIDTPVKRYSSGMYVRLAFAVATHIEPDILLIDEVLAVGDAAFQQKSIAKTKELVAGGRAVIFVSHSMHSIQEFCKRAISLNRGMITLEGPAGTVVEQYMNWAVDGATGKLKWKDVQRAPGTGDVRLLALSLESRDGSQKRVFGWDEDVLVRITYRVFTAPATYNARVCLRTTHGTAVFTGFSGPAATPPSDLLPTDVQDVGIFEATCLIPGRLLNAQRYLLDVAIAKDHPGKEALVMPEALSFSVTAPAGSPRGINGLYRGLVRPPLSWTNRFVAPPPPRRKKPA
ncbi:MAG: ABC transporter ATP-binding protein [Thermodesulfobacteriota bacterium]